ncbi:carboxylesterase family protein [Sphingomonas bisphenolicum]|uniref:carboxylesterase family protein n=1 Tax=Sphingomonas bisphenolicum TaxID=296544 RepID=UPI0021C26FD4|nr:carboxylesterase family protein [Sphingomonas bisphenolicum]
MANDPGIGSAPIMSNVPLMTGFNADEGTVFGVPKSPAAFEEYVKSRYGDFADRFLVLYPHSTNTEIDLSVKEISRDRYMANLLVWTRDRVGSSGQPVYPYLYDHPYPAAIGGTAFGAFHTASIPYLFGNLGMGPRTFTGKDATVSLQLQDHLIAFMKNGSPATGTSSWARLTADGSLVMGLGDTLGPRPAVSSPARLATFQAYLKAGGKLSLF